MTLEQVPTDFLPLTGQWSVRDPHKIFFDDESYHSGHGHAYEAFGIDPEKGALAIVRPDNCEDIPFFFPLSESFLHTNHTQMFQ